MLAPHSDFPPRLGYFARFPTTGNQSGGVAPVACRIGEIARAIACGAASTFACVAGSLSQSANAAPACRIVGSTAHIQPNPRGKRASAGTARRSLETSPAAASRQDGTGKSGRSPASMRRVSADSARSLPRIQSRVVRRNSPEIVSGATPAGTPRARAAAVPTTRRTTAFARCSRVERNGAENMCGVLLWEADALRPPTCFSNEACS